MHWPFALKAGDDLFPKDELGNIIFADAHYTETWKEMEKLVKEGLVKSIGKKTTGSTKWKYWPKILSLSDFLWIKRIKKLLHCFSTNFAMIVFLKP